MTVRLPRRLIWQLDKQIEAQRRRVATAKAQLEELETARAQMQPIDTQQGQQQSKPVAAKS